MTIIRYKEGEWDISHLNDIVFHIDLSKDPEKPNEITVIIRFSCHCYTHSFRWDPRKAKEIPEDELYSTEKETRVLSPERYELSKTKLKPLIEELRQRKIFVASEGSHQNFLTLDSSDDPNSHYLVFFKANYDKRRRVTIDIQSAYVRKLTKRESKSRTVKFDTLVKATFEGNKIRA